MKRSKFSEAQIAFVLKQAEDGTSVGEVCRKAGIVTTHPLDGDQTEIGLTSRFVRQTTLSRTE